MVIKALEGAIPGKGRKNEGKKVLWRCVSYAGHLAKTNSRNLKSFSSQDILIMTWVFINNTLVGELPKSIIRFKIIKFYPLKCKVLSISRIIYAISRPTPMLFSVHKIKAKGKKSLPSRWKQVAGLK